VATSIKMVHGTLCFKSGRHVVAQWQPSFKKKFIYSQCAGFGLLGQQGKFPLVYM